MNWIGAKTKAAWDYSRTIFLNVLVIVLGVSGELLSFAAGFDWTSLVRNPRTAAAILLAVNIMNIVLRVLTTAPVGEKPKAGAE